MNIDEPTESAVKTQLAQMQPGTLGTAVIERALRNPDRGFVCWEAQANTKSQAYFHVRTFMNAIHTGLAFCGTDTRDEWCVLGPEALIAMRTMPGFEQCEPVVCGHLVYIGRHRTTHMYVEVNTDKPLLGGNAFVVGVSDKAARGVINNGLSSFAGTENPVAVDDTFEDEIGEEEP